MGCYNSIAIPAAADQVWAALRPFHDMGWAEGVITKLDAVGSVPDGTPGARRLLNDAFHETLRSIDDARMEFTYSIDDGPGPVAADAVTAYVGRVRVLPITSGTQSFVEWESTYQSDQPNAVRDFCDPIYQALLSALHDHFA